MVFHAIRKNKIASYNFFEIMVIANQSKKIIEEHEDTIFQMEGQACKFAYESVNLNEALEEEQTTKEPLENAFALELSKLKETRDRALEVANDFKRRTDELVVAHDKLLEEFEQ
jgi:hypothetical protein